MDGGPTRDTSASDKVNVTSWQVRLPSLTARL